ncbi:ATP-binding cassette domain-containing protein [Brackiella oedipodis]|uniref:ATP-binding cassette domain-containing protein n=1 Tax=Brackiella oedipodis TaxID=124225 RepID=UPI000684BA29|nr:ABC transporter ATP-binding protein [Brackiella oedipodis]
MISFQYLSPKTKQALKKPLPLLSVSILLISLSGISLLFGFWEVLDIAKRQEMHSWVYCLLAWLVSAISYALSSYFAHAAEANFAQNVRYQTAQHMAHLPTNTLNKYGSTDLKSLLTTDINRVHYLIAHFPTEFACFFVTPMVSIVLLVNLIGLKALLVLVPAVIASLYFLLVVPYTDSRDGEARMQVVKNIFTVVDDFFKGIKIQRMYGTEQNFLKRYREESAKFSSEMLIWVKKVATLSAFATALLQAVTTFALVYLLTYQEQYDVIVGALFFSLALVIPVLRLGHGVDYIRTGKAALNRLNDFFAASVIVWGHDDLRDLNRPLVIAVHKATISYNDKAVINQLSIHFQAYQLTVITASSGRGKTTLLKALAGVQLLDAGSITINGKDIHEYSEDSFYETVLYIPQSAATIESSQTSIEQYLKELYPQASTKQLKDALRTANLPLTLDKAVMQLSGGELQRLVLAKVFLSDAEIILLDEPTSHLDDANTQAVGAVLSQIAKNQHKSLIVVSHSAALIEIADHHIDMEKIQNDQ